MEIRKNKKSAPPPPPPRSGRCHLQGRDPQPRLQGLWPTQAPGGADSGWSLLSQPAQSTPSHAPCAAAARTRQVLPVPKEEMREEAMAQATSPDGTGPQAPCSTQGPEALRKENRRLVPLACKCVSKPALFRVTKARPSGVSWMRRAFGKHLDERPRPAGGPRPPLIPGCGLAGPQRTLSVASTGWRGREDLPGPPRPH